MEQKIKCKVPEKLKKLLEDFGYDNHVALSQMTDEDISEIKEHASTLPQPILIASGHRYLIKGLQKESKNEMAIPASLKPSHKRSNCSNSGDADATSSTPEGTI